MQERAQWWLVMTRPSPETNEAEQPPPYRTAESRTWSIHWSDGVKP